MVYSPVFARPVEIGFIRISAHKGLMILFNQDWAQHPGAIIDTTTKNISFIHLADVYYHMKIQNCAFHLTLLDPDLQGVDPFSPDLPLVMQAKIARECKFNFWYYLREISRIPEPGSMVAVPFNANRSNIAMYWLFWNHVMTIVTILRQTGKTTMLVELAKYLMNFGAMNTFINLLTKSESLKAETLAKLKAYFDELPEYLNFSTKKDIFNSDEVKLRDLNNTFKGNLSSSSPKQAEKVGRGFTSPINLVDEAAFIENIAIALGAMLMTGNAARSAAEKNGNPYGTILATTAGNTSDRDGAYIYGLITGSTIWDDRFLDSTDVQDLNDLIFKNSSAGKNQTKRPIVNISLSYRQLGYDEEWLKKKLQENISTPENIKRDIFNQWLSGSSKSPIPKQYIETINNNIVEQPRSLFWAPHNYLLKWFIEEDEVHARIGAKRSFIIGVDTSDGSGGDDIGFSVRDHVDGDIICAATFNEINLITLADFFVAFLLTYENATMIIERKSTASTIIDYMITKLLAVGINPFKRLFNMVVQNKDTMTKEYDEIMHARLSDESVFIKYKKHIGFATSGTGVTARSALYSTTLMSMLKYTGYGLRDEKMVAQISALEERNGRIDHPQGGNDDMVISSLLSYWLLSEGRNLQSYGINVSTILRGSSVYLEEKYRTDQDAMDRYEAQQLEAQFAELVETLKKETNPIISRQLEMKIHKLANELPTTTNVLSVSELIESIQRDKKMRSQLRRY